MGGIINTYTLSQGIDLPELVSNPDSPPVPWGVELETGLRCRIRSGGGWNTRADSRLIPYLPLPKVIITLSSENRPLHYSIKIVQSGQLKSPQREILRIVIPI